MGFSFVLFTLSNTTMHCKKLECDSVYIEEVWMPWLTKSLFYIWVKFLLTYIHRVIDSILLLVIICWWFPYFVTIIPWLTGLLGWSNKLVSPELIPKLIEKIKSRSFFTSWCLCYSTFLYIFFFFFVKTKLSQ